VDLAAERRLVSLLVALCRGSMIASAHDLSDGGLAVAVAESCFGPPYAGRALGAEIDLRDVARGLSAPALLFAEDQGRALISVAPEREAAVLALAQEHAVPAAPIGTVSAPGGTLRMRLRETEISWSVDDLRRIYHDAIPRRMSTLQAQEAAD
jgi:phosphoribosylformylglycinamidine synthase